MSSNQKRLPIVGVMGSGREEHAALADAVGALLASMPVHLLTGGGGGVMRAVSRAYASAAKRHGSVLGILPGMEDGPQIVSPAGYPNEWVEIAIATHLPLSGAQGQEPMSRNHVNVLTSDAIIILPGGAGTASEAALTVRYGKPAIAYLEVVTQARHLPQSIPVTQSVSDVREFLTTTLRLDEN